MVEAAESRCMLSSRLGDCCTDLPSIPSLGAHRTEELNESVLTERADGGVGAENGGCGGGDGCHEPSWRDSYFGEKSASGQVPVNKTGDFSENNYRIQRRKVM